MPGDILDQPSSPITCTNATCIQMQSGQFDILACPVSIIYHSIVLECDNCGNINVPQDNEMAINVPLSDSTCILLDHGL